MKRFARLIVFVLLASMLAGCGGSQPAPAPKPAAPAAPAAPAKNEVLTYGVGVDATTLDPQFVDNVPTSNVVMHIHESLVKWDKDFKKAEGWLAESWTTTPDGKKWNFKLKQGVKFHDGTPFNAEAVKVTFERILDPKTASPRRSTLSMITKVEVVSEYEVAFYTDAPYGPMLAQLATYNAAIMSPKAIKELGKDYAKKPAGTGPYKLSDWKPADKITLVRNDDYHGTKPTLKQIVFKVIPEDTTRVMALQTGDVDVISNVPPFQVDQLKTNKDVSIILAEGFRTIYLGFNLNKKPLDNLKVRQAIAHAINREAITKDLLRGMATIAVGIESTSIPGASSNLKTYAYDPAKAKQLLKEAGFPNGFEIPFHGPVGRYVMDKQVAEAIMSQLAQVGIKTKYTTPDWSILSEVLRKGTETGMFMMGKGSPSADLDFTSSIQFKTGGSLNYMFFSDKEVDKLIEEQRVQTDQAKRYAVLQKYQERLQELLPNFPLHYEKQILAARTNVSGIYVAPNEFIDLRYAVKK